MLMAVENTYFSKSLLVLKLLLLFWADKYFYLQVLKLLQFGWRRKPCSSHTFALGHDVVMVCSAGAGGTTLNVEKGHGVRGLVFQSWLCCWLAV